MSFDSATISRALNFAAAALPQMGEITQLARNAYESAIPAEGRVKLEALVQRVITEPKSLPLTGEQQLVWLQRGATLFQVTKPLIVSLNEQQKKAREERAGLSEEAALEHMKQEVASRFGQLSPFLLPFVSKEALQTALRMERAGFTPLLETLSEAEGTLQERTMVAIEFLEKNWNKAIESLMAISEVQALPAALLNLLGIEGALTAERIAALKQALLQFATSRVADLFKSAKELAQPQPAPASASASSSASAGAASQAASQPAILRYLRSLYILLCEIEACKKIAPQPASLDLAPFKEQAEVTLKGCNLSFADLLAMSQECKAMKKLVLENVTLNGERVYDKAMIQLLLEGVEVVGAPCDEASARTKELFESADSLGLTKEQLWNFALELHSRAHEEFPVLHIAASMKEHSDARVAELLTSSLTIAADLKKSVMIDLLAEVKQAAEKV